MNGIAPQPSAAEALTAEYGGEWEIWREVRGGHHGDWVARRWQGTDRPELRAATIEELADLLAGEA